MTGNQSDWTDDPAVDLAEVQRRLAELEPVAVLIRRASETVRRQAAQRDRDGIVEGVPIEPKRLGQMVSVRLPAEEAIALREAAIARGVTVSDLLRQAAQRYIRPSGFVCAHVRASMGGAGHLVSISPPCGCVMEPVYAA